jgi:hypothetical protein
MKVMILVFTISYALRSFCIFFVPDLFQIGSFFQKNFYQLLIALFWEIPPLLSILVLHFNKVHMTRKLKEEQSN